MVARYEPTLRDHLAALRRRAVPAAIVFVLVFAAGIMVALLLPPTYRATGTILVESQQIPTDLIRSTVTSFADERILVIKQRVMTQGNLRRIIDKYDLFADERRSIPASELMDTMREHIGLELISADVVGNRRATIAFKVSFDDERAEVAYRVANELVTLFLEENVRTRTERATETTEFLTEEADRLKASLETAETQIAEYKQRYRNALPQHHELRMNMLVRTEAELKEVERAYKDAQSELRLLDVELTASRSGMGPTVSDGSQVAASPARQLAVYKTELAKLSASYSPTHPDVRSLRKKIEALEASVGGTPEPAEPITMTELATAKVQARIAATEARLASLGDQQRALQAKRAELERIIVETPQVERGMVSLLRDYENARAKYEEVRAKQMSAQMAENLEEGKKAERFSLIEPPLLPDKPIEPDRKKLATMGFFLALAGSGGIVMALESFNPRVRGAQSLAALIGGPPLVTIPYITTRAERRRRKDPRRTWVPAAAALLLIAGATAAAHFLYKPLDVVAMNAVARFAE